MYDSGVYSVVELRETGIDPKGIGRALRAGSIVRITRGWYARPGADERVVRAVIAGGRLGCLSGLAAYGVWVPRVQQVHVVYGRGHRPGPRPGIELHFMDRPCPSRAVWPLLDCLQQVAHRHDPESALVTFDSALYLGLATLPDLRAVLSELPQRAQRIGPFLGRAESGSETRVRFFLQRRNVPVRSQVQIPGVGRVDLLVGDALIVECDSDAHHRSREEHQEDRRRDLAARDLGYEVLRLTYHQIWYDWAATQQSLLRLIHERRHIRRNKRYSRNR